jgi:hypothetical protein
MPAEIINNFSSSVCRTIFADDDLLFEIHALSKHALQGLRKKPLVVVCNHHNAEFHANIPDQSAGVLSI